MAKRRRPYMPLYGGDYLKRTSALTAAARGFYVELLLWLWDRPGAGLPADDEVRMQIARATNPADWKKAWRLLEPLYVVTTAGLVDPWLEELREGVDAYPAGDPGSVSERQAAKGRRSAEVRRERFGSAQPSNQPRTAVEPLRGRSFEPAPSRIEPTAEPERRAKPRTPSSSLSEDQEHTDQEQSAGADVVPTDFPPLGDEDLGRPNPLFDTLNLPVLTKVAHTVYDDADARRLPRDAYGPEGSVSLTWLAEELKTRAAKAGLVYDAPAVQKALESAEAQRQRQTPQEAAIRLLRAVLGSHAQGRAGVPVDVVRTAVFAKASEQWPTAQFDEWRDGVVRIAWQESTWRAAPELFVLAGGKLRLA